MVEDLVAFSEIGFDLITELLGVVEAVRVVVDSPCPAVLDDLLAATVEGLEV